MEGKGGGGGGVIWHLHFFAGATFLPLKNTCYSMKIYH